MRAKGLDCSNGDNCCNAKYKVEFVYPTNIHMINNIGDLLMNVQILIMEISTYLFFTFFIPSSAQL